MKILHTSDWHLGHVLYGYDRTDEQQAMIEGRELPALPPLAERITLAEEQIETLASRIGERRACMEARHQLPWYLHGVPHSGVYRQELVQVNTLEDIHRICKGIKRDLK